MLYAHIVYSPVSPQPGQPFQPPADGIRLADAWNALDEDARMELEERCAIIEDGCRMTREAAELMGHEQMFGRLPW